MVTAITNNMGGQYLIQVNLQYKVKRANLAGTITVFRKSGYFGNADLSLPLCNTTGCKGVYTEEFAFTPAEQDEMAKLNPGSIYDWPKQIRTRYDSWATQPAACPVCKVSFKRNELADTYGFNTTKERVANIITGFFRVLNSDADILMYINKNPGGFQQVKQLRKEGGSLEQYTEGLTEARKAYYALYRLEALLKDSAAGASVESCIAAMICG